MPGGIGTRNALVSILLLTPSASTRPPADMENEMTTLRKLALTVLLASGFTNIAAAEETKIGFIYDGPAADFGYNTSMDTARKYIESKVPGVTITVFEGVPETAEVARVMERLINSGNKIIF